MTASSNLSLLVGFFFLTTLAAWGSGCNDPVNGDEDEEDSLETDDVDTTPPKPEELDTTLPELPASANCESILGRAVAVDAASRIGDVDLDTVAAIKGFACESLFRQKNTELLPGLFAMFGVAVESGQGRVSAQEVCERSWWVLAERSEDLVLKVTDPSLEDVWFSCFEESDKEVQCTRWPGRDSVALFIRDIPHLGQVRTHDYTVQNLLLVGAPNKPVPGMNEIPFEWIDEAQPGQFLANMTFGGNYSQGCGVAPTEPFLPASVAQMEWQYLELEEQTASETLPLREAMLVDEAKVAVENAQRMADACGDASALCRSPGRADYEALSLHRRYAGISQ